jgi:uncharacterized protein YfeS
MVASEDWELHPRNAHPKARTQLDKRFYWDEGDANSPLGNDTGHDTLSSYLEWRAKSPKADPILFLQKLLKSWGVKNGDWDLLDGDVLQQRLASESFNVVTRDDAIIGLAFSQIVVEGKVHSEVKRRALLAIDREMLDAVIGFRGWDNPRNRKTRLKHMKSVLSQDWS